MKNRFFIIATILLISLAACSKSFSPADFSKVKIGMNTNQVVNILGQPISKESTIILGRNREIWHYQVKEAAYTITLLDGKVTTRSGSH